MSLRILRYHEKNEADPNRSDLCNSFEKLKEPKLLTAEAWESLSPPFERWVRVTVQAPGLCPRQGAGLHRFALKAGRAIVATWGFGS